MKHNAFQKLGWVVAAAVVGIAAGTGFQGSTDKIGIVDITHVVEKSQFGLANQKTFTEMKTAREDLLRFMDEHRILNVEQSQRLRVLSLKLNISAEEKAEMDRIKKDVIAAAAKNKELAVKPNLTPEDRALMQDYAKRASAVDEQMQRWLGDFTTELQQWADKQKGESLERARAAIQEVAKAQAFTVVFEVGIAPYGVNDITADALKAMDAKKP